MSAKLQQYETHPEREALSLAGNETLLRFIADQENRNFRTEHDTGAGSNTLFIWSAVRQLAGLPKLEASDLAAWCVTCKKYHVNPHQRKEKKERA